MHNYYSVTQRRSRNFDWVWRLVFVCIGTIRLACSLAAHYERQHETVEEKGLKGKVTFEDDFLSCLISFVFNRSNIGRSQWCSHLDLWKRHKRFSTVSRCSWYLNFNCYRSNMSITYVIQIMKSKPWFFISCSDWYLEKSSETFMYIHWYTTTSWSHASYTWNAFDMCSYV